MRVRLTSSRLHRDDHYRAIRRRERSRIGRTLPEGSGGQEGKAASRGPSLMVTIQPICAKLSADPRAQIAIADIHFVLSFRLPTS